MANNSINEVGILAISTRLQRLSDRLRKDGELIYKLFEIDFQPKWFPVILTLHKKNKLTVTQLAEEIGYAHPSTIALLKEMEKNKLIKSTPDKNDERKRVISLTATGLALIEKMQPIWKMMENALSQLQDTENSIMESIDATEKLLDQQSFLQRVMVLKEAEEL